MDIARVMYFVDGENLAIRFGALLKENLRVPAPEVLYEPNVLVWSHRLNEDGHGVIRKYYYTSVPNDGVQIQQTEQKLKSVGIEAPRVFRKDKTKGSKRVDISLSTDMLVHATRRHFDIAILVAGDEDYVPLVRAVQGEGARVHVWFVSNGVSPDLLKAADSFLDITYVLASESPEKSV
jgi:uncharacterized LabA/DUF88 family protein